MFALDRRSFKSRAYSRNVLINGLRFFWVIAVIWCEIGIFFYSLSDCNWPDKQLQAESHTRPTHVLLLSDPQVRHPRWKYSWIGAIRQSIADSNTRKSWSVASRLSPHAIIYLGDMLASGRLVTSEDEYEQYYERFREMFPVDLSIPVYYLPGNNDVGLGRSVSFSKNARHRYVKHFGPVNQRVTLGGHLLVLLDAPGLVEEDYQRHARGQGFDRWNPISGGSIEFVKSIAAGEHMQPIILFSHIPLSHPETKSCGPLREQGTIRRGVGVGYQNTIGKQTTEFLLESLRPAAVFSGDDRDYCEYTHTISSSDPDSGNVTRIREVTVKSFSLAKNIRRPGFQLLSLVPPSAPPSPSAPQTIADVPCLLPNQLAIVHSFYIPSLFITLAIILFANIYPRRSKPRLSPFPPPILLSPSSQPSSPTGTRRQSGLWSPWSPVTPFVSTDNELSSRSPFPHTLRTPNTGEAPTYRASSYPTTPNDSPLLTPTVLFQDDEEEDDSMFHPQYIRRGSGQSQNAWPPGYDEEDRENQTENADAKMPIVSIESGHKRRTSHFLPAPGNKFSEQRRSLSWTFILRGRRLRMTIRAPELPSLEALRTFISDAWSWRGIRMRRRGLLWGMLGDFVSIAWPAAFVWGFVVRWIF